LIGAEENKDGAEYEYEELGSPEYPVSAREEGQEDGDGEE